MTPKEKVMALKRIGTMPCPFCQREAPVGISRDGVGKSVHLMCSICSAQVQAHIGGRVGNMLIKRSASNWSTSVQSLSP